MADSAPTFFRQEKPYADAANGRGLILRLDIEVASALKDSAWQTARGFGAPPRRRLPAAADSSSQRIDF